MAMHPEICYMLEALTYFGLKANRVSFEQRLTKALMSAGNSDEAKHYVKASRIAYERLESAVQCDDAMLKSLFGFFAGMPEGHPLGYNVATLLCSDAANHRLSYEEQKELIRSYSRKEAARAALTSLGIYSDEMEDSFDFFNLIDKLPLGQEDKFRILSVCSHPEEQLDNIFSMLDVAVAALRTCGEEVTALMEEYCANHSVKTIMDMLNSESGFVMPPAAKIEAMPYLLNPGIIAVLATDGEEYDAHIGMLYLSRFIGTPRLNDAETLETLKSISDSSRLAILRCLGAGELYGQEIAKQLGLYSTTISHHMAKLINARIVRCRLAGNKAFYSIDAEGAKTFMNSLADLLKTKPD